MQIRFSNVSFAYPNSEPCLSGIDFSVPAGSFVTLCGPSGSGKSTLLRQLKPAVAPHGDLHGEVLFCGKPIKEWDARTLSREIGMVLQNPESQIVTDRVWHELAFGLENLGEDQQTIRKRVAEMASFFGIEDWFHRETHTLSGGQKQILNLASAMVLNPSVLILDEPTGQLDPIAASEFFATLRRINQELGITVLVSEHRLESVLPISDRVLVLDHGRPIADGTPQEVGEKLQNHAFFSAMPTPMRVWASVNSETACPLTVREGRAWLKRFAEQTPLNNLPKEQVLFSEETLLSARGVTFGYDESLLKNLSLSLKKGELLTVFGGNGVGKSTLLKLFCGLLKPERGEIERCGTISYLPQDPQTLFVGKTVREDLHLVEQDEHSVDAVASLCRIRSLLERHPYDLSGGEQQRAALAKVLLARPEILLLDEPTKGLDAVFKAELASILQKLTECGIGVLIVSHDTEFCARYAHRCALLFDGEIVTCASLREFFSGNRFYTTAANRMAQGIAPQAVTAEDLIFACGGSEVLPERQEEPAAQQREKEADLPFPKWRKWLAGSSCITAAVLFVLALRIRTLSSVGSAALWLNIGLCVALMIFAGAISRKEPSGSSPLLKGKLPKRTMIAAAFVLLLIPLILYFGLNVFGTRRYYITALLVLLACLLPFFLVFEGRKPQARELVILAVLCALAVAGRAAFFMLPQFKPMIAIAIVAGIAFGAESGFLVGSVSMLVSNLMFSQGPWTPWQMFCMGLIGFLAGVVFGKGLLRRSRSVIAVFGALAALVIYGGIMNPASALMWSGTLTRETVIAYWVTGLPMDCVQAAATALFLWFGGMPMLEKLDRVKVKYGLIEKKG